MLSAMSEEPEYDIDDDDDWWRPEPRPDDDQTVPTWREVNNEGCVDMEMQQAAVTDDETFYDAVCTPSVNSSENIVHTSPEEICDSAAVQAVKTSPAAASSDKAPSSAAPDVASTDLDIRSTEKLKLLKMLISDKKLQVACTVKIDDDCRNASLTGMSDCLVKCQVELLNCIAKFESGLVELPERVVRLLQHPEGEKWLANRLLNFGLFAVFYENRSKSYVISDDEGSLRETKKQLSKLFAVREIPFESHHVNFLRGESKIAKCEPENMLLVDIDFGQKKVYIAGCAKIVKRTTDEIESVLKENGESSRQILLDNNAYKVLTFQREQMERDMPERVS